MFGGVRCQINHKELNRSRHIKLLSFLPVTSHSRNVLNFGVSVRCLKGVWKVSEGYLEGVWKVAGRCLEGVWKVSERCIECVW